MKIFWSWQSDTPGNTGRFFVRDCLVRAVKKIQQSDEITEPTEREARGALHVDSDRQGVAGSPDLAALIFEKIDAASVVVADVTPVSRIRGGKRPDGSIARQKRNMNPNVAIELGYALKSRSSQSLLMVMNEAYGGREHLPFDLAHKAGPLTYRLEQGATKADIDSMSTTFTAKLVEALKPYLSQASSLERPQVNEGVPPTLSNAIFFSPLHSLVEISRVGESDAQRRYSSTKGFYLRLIPQRRATFSRADLLERAKHVRLRPLSHDYSDHERPNEYGRIAVDLNADDAREIESLTQVFLDGELWGTSRRLMSTVGGKLIVPSMAVEEAYRRTLGNYVTYAVKALGIEAPYLVKAGGVGLKSYPFAFKGRHGMTESATFLTNEFEERCILASGDVVERNKFLQRLFDRKWDELGLVRPQNYTPADAE